MTSTASRDLGHGVRVMPGESGGLVVLSETIDLGWRSRKTGQPGSAVMCEGAGFEVVDREPWRRGDRWRLEPWTGEDVMRVVVPLDETSVKVLAEVAQRTTRSARFRPLFVLLSPILGFATAPWQRRWRDDWDFPAVLATWLSALLEMIVGAACLIEIIASMGAGAAVFPWIPRPLVFLGPYFFVESIVRLAQVSADSEPVGSLFGLVAAIFERRQGPLPEPVPSPTVQDFDEVGGSLKLLSPILRRDWEASGLLPYRGELYTFDSTSRLGESWVYVFCRTEVTEGRDGPRLRLVPPRTEVKARSFADQPGPVKTVLLTIASTLAPQRFQERWAWEMGVGEKWFTVMGASAELLGGLSNLSASGGGSALTVLLNLFFIGEALVRFGSLVFKGQACGSVLGLLLVPILERTLPEPTLPDQDQKGPAR